MKNMHDFYCGTMFDAYEFFGAHVSRENGIKGIIFRVYAPDAKEVQVISDFNDCLSQYNHYLYLTFLNKILYIFTYHLLHIPVN